MKFRRKPVIIEAIQWFKNGDHPQVKSYAEAIYMLVNRTSWDTNNICLHCGKTVESHGWIGTLEWGHIVCRGDWIIKNIKDGFYPCKPGIFAETYELVE